jgi:hypothetical protein
MVNDKGIVSAAGRNQLDGGCMASPAVIENDLLIRTKTHLYRIKRSDRPIAKSEGCFNDPVRRNDKSSAQVTINGS